MKVIKWLDEHFEEYLMVTLLSSIVIIMTYQIIRRYFFNASLTWSEEFCRYCFIWMMFAGFSYSIRFAKDLRVDAVVRMLPWSVQHAISLVILVLCLLLTGYLFINSFETVATVVRTGETSPGLHLPMKFVYASSVMGYGLGTLRYVQRLIFELREKKPEEVKA